MDHLHARLTRLALAAAAGDGFVLAGGYAVQAHGILNRVSDDVDLFTDQGDPQRFDAAVNVVRDAYTADGLTVEVMRSGDSFARLLVTDEDGRETKVEMGYDWRAEPPVMMDIGPVLHPDDAVANKVSALYSRAEARDYVDVHAALTSGRYSAQELLRLAEERDPGFDRPMFAQALRASRRWDDQDYMEYGLDAEAVIRLRSAMESWADELELGARPTDELRPSQDNQPGPTPQKPADRPTSKPPTSPPGANPGTRKTH
ncbi:nucleotidyl transferase AbiEii/AbiGii toxin family protein [Actinacidiphila paucisporea]|uniref:Nucleotidyl transferase AbiEii toxin, Type IV TA system n=1 Tax=Actinacidiphila paucisporea TaxID=310782 RepID=A0A1M7QU17_9ACTN|nr:nucleotidyl transferase AbiEii/AbiGii toxin family protein [Actinacidiphila paucisporea]SHN35263.1 Nucleotidyl transferase AbiEii toxin, Type IV TA system [Actinacidiphila paucisporea]